MSTIYTCYRQLHPPTGVDHAVFACVTAEGSSDLIVAKGMLLELYAVCGANGDAAECFLELVGAFPVAARIEGLDLVRSDDSDEAGSTESGESDGVWRPDMLAVTFEGAKLALLAYDPAVGRFTTLSIHNFTPDVIGPGAGAVETGYGLAAALKNQPPAFTAADPRGRCVAMVVAGNQLVALPTLRSRGPSAFVSREGRDHILRYSNAPNNGASAHAAPGRASEATAAAAAEAEAGANGAGAASLPSSAGMAAAADDPWTEDPGGARPSWVRPVAARPFAVDLEEAGVTGGVRAVAFLRGFSEPALAILFEAAPSAPGWLAASRYTCRLMLLSLDLAQGRAATVWCVDRIPHDATALVPVPMPVGGVQVICTNAVLHVSRGEVRSALAVNGYAAVTVDTSVHPLTANEGDWGLASSAAPGAAVDLTADVSLELDACRCAFLSPDCMLVALRRGELYVLRLQLDPDLAAVERMSLRPLGQAAPPAALVAAPAAAGESGSGLLFLGSRLADSLLMRYHVAREALAPEAEAEGGTAFMGAAAAAAAAREATAAEAAAAAAAAASAAATAVAYRAITARLARAAEAAAVPPPQQLEEPLSPAVSLPPAEATEATAAASAVGEGAAEEGDSALAAADDGDAIEALLDAPAEAVASSGDIATTSNGAALSLEAGGEAKAVAGTDGAAAEELLNGTEAALMAGGSKRPGEDGAIDDDNDVEPAGRKRQRIGGSEGLHQVGNGAAASSPQGPLPTNGVRASHAAVDLEDSDDEFEALFGSAATRKHSSGGGGGLGPEAAEDDDDKAKVAALQLQMPRLPARPGPGGGALLVDAVGYRLEVLDSLVGLGPLSSATMGLVQLGYGAAHESGVTEQTGVQSDGEEDEEEGEGEDDEAQGERGGAGAVAGGPVVKEEEEEALLSPAAAAAKAKRKGSLGGERAAARDAGASSSAAQPLEQAAPAPTLAKLLCTGGFGPHGVLTLFSSGLSTLVMTELEIAGVAGVWTLNDEAAAAAGPQGGVVESATANVLISSAMHAASDRGIGGAREWTRVLAVSGGATIAELAADDAGNPFVCEAATLDVGVLEGGSVAQVHSQGVRLVRGGVPVQDVTSADEADMGGLGVPEGVSVVQASVAGPYVAVLLSDGAVRLLALEEEGGGGSDTDLLPSSADLFGSASATAAAAAARVHAIRLFCLQENDQGGEGGEGGGGGLFTSCSRNEAVYSAAAAAAAARTAADAAGYDSGEEEWAKLFGTDYKGSHEELARALAGGSSSGAVAAAGFAAAAESNGFAGDDHELAPDIASNGVHMDVQEEDKVGSGSSPLVNGSSKPASASAPAEIAAPPGAHRGISPGWWSRTWGNAAADATAYLVLCRSGGGLEVHRVLGRGTEVSAELVFACRDAAYGPPTLWNEGKDIAGGDDAEIAASAAGVAAPAIDDVILWPVGPTAAPAAAQRLVLALHTVAGDLLVYEARTSAAGTAERERVDCFTRIGHDLITRPLKDQKSDANKAGAEAAAAPKRRSLCGMSLVAEQRTIVFSAPGARTGLLLAERGAVCVAPLASDDLGGVAEGAEEGEFAGLVALAPFRDADTCPEGGFVAVPKRGVLQFVSSAPMAAQLLNAGVAGGGGLGGGGQGHFVAQKVPMEASVYAMARVTVPEPSSSGDAASSARARGSTKLSILESLLQTPTYVVVASRTVDALTEPPDEAETAAAAAAAAAADEAAAAAVLEGEQDEEGFGGAAGGEDHRQARRQDWCHADPELGGDPPMLVERFELRLISLSEGGGARALSTHKLQRDERGLEVACLALAERKGDDSPRKAFVAAGTVFHTDRGEDAVARGRLIIFEVDYAHIATSDGGHRYMPKLKEACEREERGPVSAIRQLGRHILIAAGARVSVLYWNAAAMSMVLIGFYDATTHVVSLALVESRRHVLMAVGDLLQSVELLVWREQDHLLKLVAKDYDAAETYATGALISVPALGVVATDRCRNVKVLQYMPAAVESRGGNQLLCQADFNLGSHVVATVPRPAPPNRLGRRRTSLLLATADGGLGMLLPIDERVFRRLYALQGIMTNALEHTGAANPRQARLFASPSARTSLKLKKSMLDGTVLWRFPGLDARVQRELTRAIGTSVETVLANLLEVDLAAAVALAGDPRASQRAKKRQVLEQQQRQRQQQQQQQQQQQRQQQQQQQQQLQQRQLQQQQWQQRQPWQERQRPMHGPGGGGGERSREGRQEPPHRMRGERGGGGWGR